LKSKADCRMQKVFNNQHYLVVNNTNETKENNRISIR